MMFVFVVLAAAAPVYAQGAEAAANGGLVQWSIITAGFALAIAAAGGAVGEIRGVLILGLVLIESLVIYVLLVTLILFFIKPFGG